VAFEFHATEKKLDKRNDELGFCCCSQYLEIVHATQPEASKELPADVVINTKQL